MNLVQVFMPGTLAASLSKLTSWPLRLTIPASGIGSPNWRLDRGRSWMQVILGLLMAALGGVDEAPDSNAAPKAVVSRAGVPATMGGPMVAFEIRDIRVSSPEWRGKLILRMQPVTRQEGTAVWSLDPAGFKELLDLCQADPRSNVLQAPTMSARVGDPARMTSEETHQYVASLKRVADGPPNRSTKLAFE